MKNLILLAFAAILCVACSVEENTTLNEDTNLEVVLENYKGVFTTVDGQTRGALDITLAEDKLSATGTLTLSTGEIVMIDTDQITDLGNRKELTFTSNDLSFTMTTGEEAEIMEVNTVTFRGAESAILVGQSTERAPLDPIVGSYTCPGCEAPLDNVGSETFNIFIAPPNGAGNSQVFTQTTLGSTIYNGNATQSGCTIINGEQTMCNLNSGTIFGVTGTAFNPGAGPVRWSGTHTFDNDTNPSASDCSTVSGTWLWDAQLTIGLVQGVMTSNPMGDCATPIVTLVSEDFEDATVGYILRVEPPSTTGGGIVPEDISEAGDENDDYFGSVALSDLNAENQANNYGGFEGSRFFGAYDTDGITSYGGNTDFMSINWFDLDVNGLSTITVTGLFSEAESAWDAFGEFTQFTAQYSFNNTDWFPIFSISAVANAGAMGEFTCGFDPDNMGPNVTHSPVLSNTFMELSDSFSNTGNPTNTVSIRFLMDHLTGADESIHFDNIVISGN